MTYFIIAAVATIGIAALAFLAALGMGIWDRVREQRAQAARVALEFERSAYVTRCAATVAANDALWAGRW